MTFKMKYEIKYDLLPLVNIGRRQGGKIGKVKFATLHDVGNDGFNKNTGRKEGTTARGNIQYYKNTPNVQASAHSFIDDKEILICVPLNEKAFHVIYNVTTDNNMYGDDANDIAIGVELCYYPENKTRTLEAYKKYIWFNAWLAYNFKFDPKGGFVGHQILDPKRKVDPMNALKIIGKTYKDLLDDIVKEYEECTKIVATASTQKPSVIIKEEVKLEQVKFNPSSNAILNSAVTVLKRFEAKELGIDPKWRLQLLNGEMTIHDAVGLLFVAIDRGLIVGK